MTAHFDVIVLGVGGMGSATVHHLARRGKRVLGIEQFDIPHVQGSSHGISRIIRLAYYEHPSYVPLLRRAYELWRDLEGHAGEHLLHITGSIDAGPQDGACFNGSRDSCQIHDLPHEVLDGASVNERFPAYRLPAEHAAVFQPDGGFVLSERAIVAHVVTAQALGAVVHGRERVTGWEPSGDGVEVRTDRSTYRADRLVVTAGAWTGSIVPALRRLALPERQVLAWLQPDDPSLFQPARFPVFNLEVPEGRFYGLPIAVVPGFKFGRYHHFEEEVDPDDSDRSVTADDEAMLRQFATTYFPSGAGPTMALRSCMFTNTPDEHFVVGVQPDHPQVVIASPCSGHGYKFASVLGEVLSDLAIDGETSHDISLFSLARLTQG